MVTIKSFVISTIVIAIFCCIGWVFWQQDLKYSLPTPVPQDYKVVPVGAAPNLGQLLQGRQKPILLHFFNPHCPCSRFNAQHFRSLIKQYGQEVDFYALIQDDGYPQKAIERFHEYKMNVQAMFDANGKLAKACGVYSTPQAVLLQPNGSIFYRGNYNKSRYCTQPNTNYAQLALEALLAGKSKPPAFPASATTAYGCQLPAYNDSGGLAGFF